MSEFDPVSPMLSVDKSDKAAGDVMIDLEEEELDPKSVTVDEVIAGEGIVTLDENGPGALQPKQVPGPKEMTKAERERHFAAGHLPYMKVYQTNRARPKVAKNLKSYDLTFF